MVIGHVFWKEILNSDRHKSHQYQQNQLSPLILTELTKHKKVHDIFRLKSWSWFKTDTKSGGVKPIHGIPTLLSW